MRTDREKKKRIHMGFLDNAELPTNTRLTFLGAGDATIALVSLKKGKSQAGRERYEAEFFCMSGDQKGQFAKKFFDVNNPNFSYGPKAQGELMQLVGCLHHTDDVTQIKALASTDKLLSGSQPARGLICNTTGLKARNKAGEIKLDKYDQPYINSSYTMLDAQLTPEQIAKSRKAIETHASFEGERTPDAAPDWEEDPLAGLM